MSHKLHIAVILGSTRPNRFSDKPGTWIYKHVRDNYDDVTVELVDLRDWNLPFFDQPISPAMNEGSYGSELIDKWAEKISSADAYILVTPEYNHGTSAVLKNALDTVYKEWNRKPVAFVSYGGVGGARAVEQLRQTAVELQMAPVRSAVHIPGDKVFPVQSGDKEWKPHEDKRLTHDADTMMEQLLWWGRALKEAVDNVST